MAEQLRLGGHGLLFLEERGGRTLLAEKRALLANVGHADELARPISGAWTRTVNVLYGVWDHESR